MASVPILKSIFSPNFKVGGKRFYLPPAFAQMAPRRYKRRRYSRRRRSLKPYRRRKRVLKVLKGNRRLKKSPGLFNQRIRFAGAPNKTLFPRRLKVYFRSNITIDFNNATSAFHSKIFYPNDLNNPWGLESTHQGRGIDQLGRLYRNYLVVGARLRYKIYITDTEDSNKHPMYFTQSVNQAGQYFGSLLNAQEFLAPWAYKLVHGSSAPERSDVEYQNRISYSIKKVHPREKDFFDGATFAANLLDGTGAGSPATKDEFRLYFQQPDWVAGKNVSIHIECMMEQVAIVYNARLFQPSDA